MPYDHPTTVAAVVLAGGFGTRVRHLLPDRPKPMATVAGRPFIEYVVHQVVVSGIREVALSTGYLAEVIASYFSNRALPSVTVRCVVEREPLGTAGGFQHAARESGFRPDVWLVLNGDSMVVTDLNAFIHEFLLSGADAAMIGLAVPDASRYGTLKFDENGKLICFAEKCPGSAVINAGVYAFHDQLLDHFPPRRPLAFETDVFPYLVEARAHVHVRTVTAPFLDIGTPESLGQAEDFISAQHHLSIS